MIEIWTVYDHPKDYPDKYVARLWRSLEPTNAVLIADTLDQLRALLPPGFTKLGRHVTDDPVIVESWI